MEFKREVVIFLSFRKNKETKQTSVQISNKIKRVALSLSKMCRSKIFVTQQNFIRTLKYNFDHGHLKFGKRKKQTLKHSIFDSLSIVNQTISHTEFVIAKSYFAHIMRFQETKCQIFVKFENTGIKDGFRSISQQFYGAIILWWVEQKNFGRHFI